MQRTKQRAENGITLKAKGLNNLLTQGQHQKPIQVSD